MTKPEEQRIFNITAAGKYLGFSPTKMQNIVDNGRIPVIDHTEEGAGKRTLRIRLEDLQALEESRLRVVGQQQQPRRKPETLKLMPRK